MSGTAHARLQHASCAGCRPQGTAAAARPSLHQHLGVSPAAAQQQQQQLAATARPLCRSPRQQQRQHARGCAPLARPAAADAAPQAPAAPPAAAAPAGEPPRRPAPLYKMPKEPLAEFGFSKAFSDKYELLEKIGKGASCTVHAAVHRRTGEKCVRARARAPCALPWLGCGMRLQLFGPCTCAAPAWQPALSPRVLPPSMP